MQALKNELVITWHEFRDFLIHATPTQRCLLAILLNTPFILLLISFPSIALFVPSWRSLIQADNIKLVNAIQIGIVVFQWLIAIHLWPRRYESRRIPGWHRVIACVVAFSYLLEAFLGGNLTYPTSMMVITMIPIGLLLLEVSAVLMAVSVVIFLLLLNDVLLLGDMLPYAFGYGPGAFIDGKHHFLAELLRSLTLYLHFACYGCIVWLLFKQHDYHRRLLQSMARKDALTGLANRRYFLERLEQACKAQKKNDFPLALVLMDADHFKRINDQYGHSVGDEVLVAIANVLRETVPDKKATLGRLGGEEFAILIPECSAGQLMVVCEQIQQRLDDIWFSAKGKRFQVTLSMGLVESTQQSSSQILNRADKLLYEAKMNGRNQIATVPLGANSLEDSALVQQTTTTDPVSVE